MQSLFRDHVIHRVHYVDFTLSTNMAVSIGHIPCAIERKRKLASLIWSRGQKADETGRVVKPSAT